MPLKGGGGMTRKLWGMMILISILVLSGPAWGELYVEGYLGGVQGVDAGKFSITGPREHFGLPPWDHRYFCILEPQKYSGPPGAGLFGGLEDGGLV